MSSQRMLSALESTADLRAVARVQRPTILLVLRCGEFPSETLKRAGALCEALNADLTIMRVLDCYPVISPSLRPFAMTDGAQALDGLLKLRFATSAWAESALGRAFPQARLELQRGGYVQLACRRARELNASVIVVAPGAGPIDSAIESIAISTGISVLVGRWSEQHDSIVVAATDLEDPRFPVLRAAAELSRALGASLVPVHNISPLSARLRGSVSRPEAFARAAAELHLGQAGVVSEDSDAARAILREARAREADLVIVGLRPRSWLQGLRRPSVASCVLRDARRSVLLTPLPRERAKA
jgi:nucleotide-binding universal stress UspA family protein